MEKNYNQIIQERANHVFGVMAQRVSSEDLNKIKEAFELAQKAHAPQIRKSGEPYILHPIAVATIVAEEMQLGANPVCAAFLHDVVEDTPCTFEGTTVRGSRCLLKIIAVQRFGGYFCEGFQRSGSRSRYFPIGVLGGQAAHRSMMSQKYSKTFIPQRWQVMARE